MTASTDGVVSSVGISSNCKWLLGTESERSMCKRFSSASEGATQRLGTKELSIQRRTQFPVPHLYTSPLLRVHSSGVASSVSVI